MLTCLVLGAGLATAASAQSITVNLDSITPSQYALVSGNSGDATFSNELVGGLDLTVTAQSGADYPTTLEAFCVEMAQNINLPSTGNQYTVVPLDQASSGVGTGLSADIPLAGIGDQRAANLEILYAFVFGGTYDPSISLNGAAATEAFQLAVWKLSQDSGFNLEAAGNASTGFWVTGVSGSLTQNTVNQAQTLLNWVEANPNADKMALVALHSSTLQDLIVPADSVFTAIPEAADYAQVLGVAVLAFALVRRRRQRAQAVAA
jgi:hypothetical protein